VMLGAEALPDQANGNTEFFSSARQGGHFQCSQTANRKLRIVSVRLSRDGQ
jgi:hypothetical protein